MLDVVDVSLTVSRLHQLPSLLDGDLLDVHAGESSEKTVDAAIGSDVTFLLAQFADGRRLVCAVGSTMAGLTADTALAGELTLDTRVGTLGLTVAHLAAVVALSRVATAALRLVRAVAREVTILTTCLLYTSPSPRDGLLSRMPSSA